MIRRRCFLPPLILLLLAATPAHGLLGEELPLDHWAYPAIEELRLRGVNLVSSVGLRPYWTREVTDSLRTFFVNGNRAEHDDPVVRGLLNLLWREFADEADAQAKHSYWTEAGAVWAGGDWGAYPDDEERAKGTLEVEAAVLWGSRISAYTRAEIDSDGSDDPDFLGREWRGGITGAIEYSNIAAWGQGWRAQLGRMRTAWGPGLRGGLILSGRSPSLDGLRAEISRGRVRFLFLFASLDAFTMRKSDLGELGVAGLFPADDTPLRVPRYFSGHRVEWRPVDGLTLGATETVVYGGPGRTWEPHYLLPLVLFYNEQWNRSPNDNVLVGLDIEWLPGSGRRIYGELLIDDYQYTRDREPQEIGFTIGGEMAGSPLFRSLTMGLEYTRLNTFVYGQVIPWNRYTMGRTVLGHQLGPDADQWRFWLTLRPAGSWRVTSEFYRVRRGEMTPDSPRPAVVDFPAGFPTGTTESTWGARTDLAWRSPPGVQLETWLGAEEIDSRHHVAGEDKVRWLAGIRLRVGLRGLRRVGHPN